MYDVNFVIKHSSSLGGYESYSVPCARLEIALALASFLGKASSEPGVNLVYERISVEPVNLSFEDEKKS